jgi:hypothetical protein
MTEKSPSPNTYPTMSLVQTWTKALTKPNEEAYLEIVNDPGASLGKALLWLTGTAFVGGLFSGIISWLFGSNAFNQFDQYFDLDIPFQSGNFLSVITTPFFSVIGILIGTFIATGLVQLVAKMLGGTGTFQKLFYGFTAYQAPLRLVILVLSAIPFLNCLIFPLGIYGFVLNVIANKATHQYDTGKAIISSLAPGLLVFLFCCCMVALITITGSAILGPTVENVFNNIQGTLAP